MPELPVTPDERVPFYGPEVKRIIVCAVQGDWIPWERDERPTKGACPFGDCDCTPMLYVRADA